MSIQQRHVRHIGRVSVAAEGSAGPGGSLHDLRLRLDADEHALVEGVRVVHIREDQLIWLQRTVKTVKVYAGDALAP